MESRDRLQSRRDDRIKPGTLVPGMTHSNSAIAPEGRPRYAIRFIRATNRIEIAPPGLPACSHLEPRADARGYTRPPLRGSWLRRGSQLRVCFFVACLCAALTRGSASANEGSAEGGTAKGTVVTAKAVLLFDASKLWFCGVTLSICGTVILCTELARRGKPFYVRPIAGLQAIEEAVGRATEMGKPMLFVPGIQDVNEIDTVAGLTILASVAKTAAEYDTPLEVPTSRTLVMTAAREAVQAAALAAGRPDYYNEDRIYYVTDEQFGYVASVCGWMYREKPAACFFLGKFYAESLILAETGNAVGAIQIAGTAETTQLPFFVAACDYTLLGEELFAASAYLSGEPAQLGMLKGQDFGKLAAMVLIVVGCLIATWDAVSPRETDDGGKDLPRRVQWITDTVLKGG